MNSNQHEGNHSDSPGSTDRSFVPWSEVFSRHDTVLSSHLSLLNEVKSQLAADSDTFRAVSSMVNKTVQSMNQSKILRKAMMNQKIDAFYTEKSSSSPSNPSNPSAFSQKNRTEPNPSQSQSQSQPQSSEPMRRKRPRTEKDTPPRDSQTTVSEDPIAAHRSSKRRRDNPDEPPQDYAQPPQQDYPGEWETEDISEEVQRRLRIKEEIRRKKESSRVEKRKRDSLQSNEGRSPGSSKHQKKRTKLGDEAHDRDSSSTSGTGGEKVRKGKKPR
ncbi:hypothetical protein N7493_009767 [Penicillium malachiteum]|uniref:Uncharacterized protein n=1 Tax=Penicillium malachiteum TaxID=1324776 RepID=A0AAD6HEX6_9EURO|nr:hypothetical protein N7493_009767 [Penicillium malachiteum]